MGRKSTAPRSATPNSPTDHPPIRPSFLSSITPPPDLATHVVADQQRAVRQHQQTHRPVPARAVGALPAANEIIDPRRAPAAAVHVHAYDFRTGRDGPVPGAV